MIFLGLAGDTSFTSYGCRIRFRGDERPRRNRSVFGGGTDLRGRLVLRLPCVHRFPATRSVHSSLNFQAQPAPEGVGNCKAFDAREADEIAKAELSTEACFDACHAHIVGPTQAELAFPNFGP